MTRLIIDEANSDYVATELSKGFTKGWIERDISQEPFGAAPTQWDDRWLIPRSEWSDRIKERKAQQRVIRPYIESKGWKVKHQEQMLWCWAYGPTAGVEVKALMQGLPYVPLSASAVAARVNGFRNAGGWGNIALHHLVANGAPPEKMWPGGNAGFNRRFDTELTRDVGMLFRVEEYIDLPPNRPDVMMSCLLHGWPVPAGFPWWGHLVLCLEPDEIEANVFGVDGPNSWGPNWGDRGWFTIHQSRMASNNQVAIRSVRAWDQVALNRIDPTLVV